MKKLFTILAVMALIFSVSVKADAATSDDITITVTIQNVSVTVSPTSWGIGTISSGDVVTNDTFSATNGGNVTEDLAISVDDSATTWTAGASAGSDIFALDVGAAGGPYTTNVTTGDVSLTAGLVAAGSYNFGLEFNSPSPSSVFTQQTITVTVSATAS